MVDALIGVAIIAFVAVFVLGSFTAFNTGAAAAADSTQGLYLAQQVLEQFKANDGQPADEQKWEVTQPNTKYNITVKKLSSTVINNAGLGNKLYPYQVEVKWTSSRGGRAVKLVGYYYCK